MARRARRPSWNEDLAGRLAFEQEARRAGHPFAVGLRPMSGGRRRWVYETPVELPVYDELHRLRIVLPAFQDQRPLITTDGAFCGRHRFGDRSLCMWWARDPLCARWAARDGLLALVQHAVEHLYCEASCRNGQGWPKPEAPGDHPQDCRTCSR